MYEVNILNKNASLLVVLRRSGLQMYSSELLYVFPRLLFFGVVSTWVYGDWKQHLLDFKWMQRAFAVMKPNRRPEISPQGQHPNLGEKLVGL